MDIDDEADRITVKRHGPLPDDNTHQCLIAAAVVCGAPYLTLVMLNIRGDKVEFALLLAGAAVGLVMRWANKSARTKWFRAHLAIRDELRLRKGN